jgi:hypothetical protein
MKKMGLQARHPDTIPTLDELKNQQPAPFACPPRSIGAGGSMGIAGSDGAAGLAGAAGAAGVAGAAGMAGAAGAAGAFDGTAGTGGAATNTSLGVDSDCDGVSDVDELQAGTNPNPGSEPLCVEQPLYGCARVSPQRRTPSLPKPNVITLLLVAALAAWRARRS